MKIYVAAHCRWAANYVALQLEKVGHVITSSWIYQEFKPVDQVDNSVRAEIAKKDTDEVLEADALVLIAGPDRYPGGKFVELGIALGSGKKIVILGRRENMLCYHPSIKACEEISEVMLALQA